MASDPSVVYLDASVAVKLMKPEAESSALRGWLTQWPHRISSDLLRVELHAAAHRYGLPVTDAEKILRTVRLIPLNGQGLTDACASFNPAQRALDAIHLAVGLSGRQALAWFVTYDTNLASGARNAGLPVTAPS